MVVVASVNNRVRGVLDPRLRHLLRGLLAGTVIHKRFHRVLALPPARTLMMMPPPYTAAPSPRLSDRMCCRSDSATSSCRCLPLVSFWCRTWADDAGCEDPSIAAAPDRRVWGWTSTDVGRYSGLVVAVSREYIEVLIGAACELLGRVWRRQSASHCRRFTAGVIGFAVTSLAGLRPASEGG